jgi:beta-glucanase (GH16 family)
MPVKRIPMFIFAVLITLGLIASHASARPLPPAGSPAESDTLFFENFTAPVLDRSVWNVIVTGGTVNNEQQAYIDSTSSIRIVHGADGEGASGGALLLQASYRPGFTTPQGKKFDFTSGRIDTRGKAEFTYGIVSARMKLPSGSGFWPAFWMLGQGRWPDVGEIDIMESVGEADWTSVALHGPHYFGETPLVNKFTFDAGTDCTAWHVYTVDWTTDTLLFKIDDRLIYRVTRAMVEHYGKWAFDAPKFIILNLALGGAYPVKTNGVKTPYNGLPESTVENIKEGKGRVLVDWVCVMKPRTPHHP